MILEMATGKSSSETERYCVSRHYREWAPGKRQLPKPTDLRGK